MKAMKWGSGHRDIYSYSHELACWLKIDCNLEGMECTAPDRLERGTKFDYSVKSIARLENAEEQVFLQS